MRSETNMFCFLRVWKELSGQKNRFLKVTHFYYFLRTIWWSILKRWLMLKSSVTSSWMQISVHHLILSSRCSPFHRRRGYTLHYCHLLNFPLQILIEFCSWLPVDYKDDLGHLNCLNYLNLDSWETGFDLQRLRSMFQERRLWAKFSF